MTLELLMIRTHTTTTQQSGEHEHVGVGGGRLLIQGRVCDCDCVLYLHKQGIIAREDECDWAKVKLVSFVMPALLLQCLLHALHILDQQVLATQL